MPSAQSLPVIPPPTTTSSSAQLPNALRHLQSSMGASGSSLMDDVRRRMDEAPLPTFIAGTHHPITSSPDLSPLPTQLLLPPEPKTTCGQRLTVSYCMLVTTAFVMVTVVMMTIQVVVQVVINRDVVQTLTDSCNATTAGLVNVTALALLNSVETALVASVNMTRNSVQSSAMRHTQSAVGATYNFIQASGPNVSMQAIGTFLELQIVTQYLDFVDWIIVAPAQGSVQYLDTSSCDNGLGPADQYCNQTVAASNGNGTLFRCPLPATTPGACVAYSNFSIVQQPPVATQRARRNQTHALVWDPPSVLQDIQQNGAPVLAVTLSWPYLDGAVYAPLTTYSLADLMQISLTSVLPSDSQSNLGTALSINSTSLPNNSACYIVDATAEAQGVLLGAAWGSAATTVAPNKLQFANQSGVDSIRLSAIFLQTSFGPFGTSSAYTSGVTGSFMFDSASDSYLPCSIYSNPLDCTVVAAVAGVSPDAGASFPTARRAKFVVVTVLDFGVFDATTAAKVEQVLNTTLQDRQQAQLAVDRLIGVGVAVAVIAVIVGALLAVGLAVLVSRPLGRLAKAMAGLRRFNFSASKQTEVSRITDVAELELGFFSLHEAIQVFAKFVPETVVRGIVRGQATRSQLHVERRTVTVLFSDVRNFTSISEKLALKDLLYLLTRYLTLMTLIVESYDGVVSEILGDGLLCFFGAPDECEDHRSKACAAALAMQATVQELSREFAPMLLAKGLGELEVRVGINTGEVLAGNVGSPTKLKFGCIGDAVNTAARLEGLCKLFGVNIMAAESTWALLSPGFSGRLLDNVVLKGKSEPTSVYEIAALSARIESRIHVGDMQAAEVEAAAGGGGAAAAAALPDEEVPGSATARHKQRSSVSLARFIRIPTGMPKFNRRPAIPRMDPNAASAANAATTAANASFGPIIVSEAKFEAKMACVQNYVSARELLVGGKVDEAAQMLQSPQAAGDVASALLLSKCLEVLSGKLPWIDALKPLKLDGKDF